MDTIIVALLILGFATWRVSSLLVSEEGPFSVLAKFRFIIGVRYDELSRPIGTNVIADLFTCVWCASVWIGLFFAVIWYINNDIAIIIALPFAISSLAIIIDSFVKGE